MSGKNKLIGLKKRGFAIPSVLLSITLILSIVIGYSTSAQNHVLRVKRYLSEVDGQLAARSGLELAVGILLERFASPEYEQKLTLINGDAVYCRYNKRDRLAISIQDIAGRIDLNFASKSLLEKYFSSFHEQHVILENVTQAIIERRQIRAYAIVDELQEIEGIDPAFLHSIRNDLTTFGIQNSLANDALSEELKKRLQGLPKSTFTGYPSNKRYAIDISVLSDTSDAYFLEAVIELRPGQRPPFKVLKWVGFSSTHFEEYPRGKYLKDMPAEISFCTT